MDARGVDRELRRTIWPALRAKGFDSRATRVAWRYTRGVELVEIPSVLGWDQIGCTSFSVTAWVATLPVWVEPKFAIPEKDGRLRPHYWHCDPLKIGLEKSIDQPWFRPFSAPPNPRLPRSMVLHREGLMKVVRRDIHDRPGVWFVKEDGSNIAEVMEDLLRVITTEGLRMLDALTDPMAAMQMVQAGRLTPRPGSPAARDLVQAARKFLDADGAHADRPQ